MVAIEELFDVSKPSRPADAPVEEVPKPEIEVNDAQDELMKRAAKKREEQLRKKKEEEAAAAKKVDEGFLGNNNTSNKTGTKGTKSSFMKGFLNKKTTTSSTKKKKPEVIEVTGNKDKDKVAASLNADVQKAMSEEMKKTLNDPQQWCTPELMKVFASRPDLMAGLQDPKVQDAIQLMQKDPKLAEKKYKGDKAVEKYLEEFSRLMGTHFQEMAKKAAKEEKTNSSQSSSTTLQTTTAASMPITASITTATDANPASMPPLPPEQQKQFDAAMNNPEVTQAMQDPEVVKIIMDLQKGKDFDLKEIRMRDEKLFKKFKLLIDSGVLGVSA